MRKEVNAEEHVRLGYGPVYFTVRHRNGHLGGATVFDDQLTVGPYGGLVNEVLLGEADALRGNTIRVRAHSTYVNYSKVDVKKKKLYVDCIFVTGGADPEVVTLPSDVGAFGETVYFNFDLVLS